MEKKRYDFKERIANSFKWMHELDLRVLEKIKKVFSKKKYLEKVVLIDDISKAKQKLKDKGILENIRIKRFKLSFLKKISKIRIKKPKIKFKKIKKLKVRKDYFKNINLFLLKLDNRLRSIRFNFKNVSLILIGLVIIIGGLFLAGGVRKDCGDDIKCFNSAASKCGSAEVLFFKRGDLYKYSIEGSDVNNCIINVKVIKMDSGSDIELVSLFEGKSMECYVPKSILKNSGVDRIDNLMDYCSGELKEATLQMIIDRMYDLIFKNMEFILKDVEKELEIVRLNKSINNL